MTRIVIALLGLATAAPALAQEPAEPLLTVLRRAQAEHWMVRVTTSSGDTVAGRIERATSEVARFQDSGGTLRLSDIVRLEHGHRDNTDARAGTGLVVTSVLLGAAGVMMMGEDPDVWLVAGVGIVAVGALVWYAATHADESLDQLRWLEAWPSARDRPARDW
jgi:hypothetical protein